MVVSGRRVHGLRPGVGWLWAVNVAVTGFGARQRPGEGVITNGAVGRLRMTCCEAENPGGHNTPRCGNLMAGRQDAAWEEKNANMDVCVFFYLSAPGYGPGAVPPPLSRKRTGLRPEPDHMTFGSMLLCAVIFHVGRRRE
jgi:hypothetical protein